MIPRLGVDRTFSARTSRCLCSRNPCSLLGRFDSAVAYCRCIGALERDPLLILLLQMRADNAYREQLQQTAKVDQHLEDLKTRKVDLQTLSVTNEEDLRRTEVLAKQLRSSFLVPDDTMAHANATLSDLTRRLRQVDESTSQGRCFACSLSIVADGSIVV